MQTTNSAKGDKKMTTNEMIEKANDNALKVHNCWGYNQEGRVDYSVVSFKDAIAKIEALNLQPVIQDGVECKAYYNPSRTKKPFRNEFHTIKADGSRGQFSKAKAVAKFG
jgi:hypothetical protein